MVDFLKSNQRCIRGCYLYEYCYRKFHGKFHDSNTVKPAPEKVEEPSYHGFPPHFRRHFPSHFRRNFRRNFRENGFANEEAQEDSLKIRENKIRKEHKECIPLLLYLGVCKKLNLKNEEFLYRDAEVLYWQFENGDYDVSKEFDSKKVVSLLEFPVDVLDLIVTKLDLESRNNFSLTCRAFRNLSLAFLGNSFDEVELTLALENCKYVREFSISNSPSDFLTVDYCHEKVDYCMVKTRVERFVTKDFMDLGFEHFRNFLGTPNLKIGELRIQTLGKVCSKERNRFFDNLEKILKEKNLEVKILNVHTNYEKMYMMSILPYLEPQKLEEIHFSSDVRRADDVEENVSRIFEMIESRQWKEAKVLKIQRVLGDLTVQNIAHFENFEGMLSDVQAENFLFLKNALLNSPKKSKSFKIDYNYMNVDLVHQIFGKNPTENDRNSRKLLLKFEVPNHDLTSVLEINSRHFHAYFL